MSRKHSFNHILKVYNAPNQGVVKYINVLLKTCKHLQKQPPELFCKKVVLGNFAKFTGKHLSRLSLLIKLQTLQKKRPWHRCFPLNFAKFLRTPFLQNTSRRLLLKAVFFFTRFFVVC